LRARDDAGDVGTVRRVSIWNDFLRRVLLTVACIALYRVGSSVPLPTIRGEILEVLKNTPGDALWQQFVGTPLSSVSFFAVGIIPFITASLVIQLLRSALPWLRNADGTSATQERLRRVTRATMLVIATLQALVIVLGHREVRHGAVSAIADGPVPALVSFVLLLMGFLLTGLIAGTISRHGIGSGVSVLLLVNLLGASGAQLRTLLPELTPTMLLWAGGLLVVGMLLAVVGMRSHHLLLVRTGRLDLAGQAAPIEMRAYILQGGVLTLIFAATLLGVVTGIVRPILGLFGQADALSVGTPLETVLYFILVIGLARLQLRVTLDPVDVANNLAKQNYFLDGVRPGWATADRVSGMSNSAAAGLLLLLLPMTLASSIGGPLTGGVTVLLPASTLLLASTVGIELLRTIRDGTRRPIAPPPLGAVTVGQSPWDTSARCDA
jgi:preprotein translocase subunit SecY